MRTEGQADMTKLNVAFHNFANAPSEQEWRVVKNKNTNIKAQMDEKYYGTTYTWQSAKVRMVWSY